MPERVESHQIRSGPAPFTARQRAGWGLSLGLTLLRLLLAPACVILARDPSSGRAIAAALVAGFVSDVLDGVVARRANASTAFLRRLDSGVDTVFYLGIAWAAWRLFPGVMRANAWLIAAVLVAEGLNYVAAYLRFGQAPAYHAISAKAFGLLLFVALLVLFGTGERALLAPALVLGVLATAESIAISCVLPVARHDVASLAVALRLRRSPVAPEAG
ncbi:MAG TPA: CDP-alcohol phosphatidyltransferase family protein [Gemmatimonadaceae bacterium]|nr:CDP-alcohol phosphatidyltransferase family protein [Gemmatimonadaceae bacterium]